MPTATQQRMTIHTEITDKGVVRVTCTICRQSQELDETGRLLVQITEFAREHRHEASQ